jgi:hypothetical protein
MRVLASATANISYEFLTANSVFVRRASDNPDRNLISPAQLCISVSGIKNVVVAQKDPVLIARMELMRAAVLLQINSTTI